MLYVSWNAMNCTGLERSWLSWSGFLHRMLSGRQAANHSIACASLETQHTEIRITTVILSDSSSEMEVGEINQNLLADDCDIFQSRAENTVGF